MAESEEIDEKMSKVLSFIILRTVDPAVFGARLGRLTFPGRKALETPNFIAVSSRGVVPHLSPDVILAHAEFGGVHLALEDCKLVLQDTCS